MTLWKVDVLYHNENNNIPVYTVLPYHFRGHLICCWRWYGIKGLKWCYLFKKQAERKAKRLNQKRNMIIL